jgi:hypothetical protein
VGKRNEEEPSLFELLFQIFKSPSQLSVLQQSCQTSIVALGSLQPPSQLVTRTTHPAFVPAKSPERHLEDSATTLPSLSPRFKANRVRFNSTTSTVMRRRCALLASMIRPAERRSHLSLTIVSRLRCEMLSLIACLYLRPALAAPLPNVTIEDTGVAPSVGISGSAFAPPFPP